MLHERAAGGQFGRLLTTVAVYEVHPGTIANPLPVGGVALGTHGEGTTIQLLPGTRIRAPHVMDGTHHGRDQVLLGFEAETDEEGVHRWRTYRCSGYPLVISGLSPAHQIVKWDEVSPDDY